MQETVLWMSWVYWIVVFPLAFVTLAGPVFLKQIGIRVFFSCVAVLWLVPVAVTYLYPGAPQPFDFYSQIPGIPASLAHVICFGMPIWGAAASIWFANKIHWTLVPQMFSAAIVGGALLFLVANDLVLLLLRPLFGH